MKLESRRRTQSSRAMQTPGHNPDTEDSRTGSEGNLASQLTSEDRAYASMPDKTSPGMRKRDLSDTEKNIATGSPGIHDSKRPRRYGSPQNMFGVSETSVVASEVVISASKTSRMIQDRNNGLTSSSENKSKSQASTNSMTSSLADNLSVKSEDSLTPTVRSSGRRTRPSARLSAGMVPHKDTSEADSLSMLSDLDTHSNISTADAAAVIASLNARRRSTDKLSSSSDDSATQSSASASKDSSGPTEVKVRPGQHPTRYSPASEIASVTADSTGPSLAPSENYPTNIIDDDEASLLVTRHNAFTDPDDTDLTRAELTTSLERRASSSSLSSELSEVSSISSLGSQETASSTGSNTIRHLTQTTESGNETDRQRACLQALTLVKKWRQTWLVLEKKVKANAKKQERNRIAREQSVNGKRRR